MFAGTNLVLGQDEAAPRPDCSRIDKTRPPLFITFEHAESKDILLRLQNNSHCYIYIPTNQLGPNGKVVKQPNGGLRVEATDELSDGSRVPVVYSLFNLRGSRNTVLASDGCVIMTRKLLPQRSVTFRVPLDYFRKHVDIGVEVGYPWEYDGGSASSGEFAHYVFFRSDSVPNVLGR
jgi:hypothetical protein